LGAGFSVGSGPNLFFETDDFLLNIHMVGQLKLQYFGAGFWVGRSPNLFFNRYRCSTSKDFSVTHDDTLEL